VKAAHGDPAAQMSPVVRFRQSSAFEDGLKKVRACEDAFNKDRRPMAATQRILIIVDSGCLASARPTVDDSKSQVVI